MYFIIVQKGSQLFVIPTPGTPQLLHYYEFSHGNVQCCCEGGSGCHEDGNYPGSFHVKNNCRGSLTALVCF